MTCRVRIGSLLRICLAVTLVVASVGSACLALTPAPAMASTALDHGAMPAHSGVHMEGGMDDCCPPGSVPQASCCTQPPSTVVAADQVLVALPISPAPDVAAVSCDDWPACVGDVQPPIPEHAVSPLRI